MRQYTGYHRDKQELIRQLEASGFTILSDLVPLYDMIYQLRRVSGLSKQARQRLKWFDYYHKTKNVSLTCRHFDISRKTFYKWAAVYDNHNLTSLEDRDRAPKRTRQPEITSLQEERIINLRKQYLRYGKEKLSLIYQRTFQEPISAWKIYRTIRKYRLYYHPMKTARIARKRRLAVKRKRITELRQKYLKPGYLICLDAIVIYWQGVKRYIFTAIDILSKIAFARMYSSKSSYSGQDFLLRLNYLLESKIENIQTDNGSEFSKYFNRTCVKLDISRYYNRVRTPQDNSVNEKFNDILKREFIDLKGFTPDINQFNRNLTDWLVEYNFNRPNQTLKYLTPIQFIQKHAKVSPMYPTSTTS